MGASAVGRESLYAALIADRPGRALASRKILDSEAPPIEPKVKAASFKEVDIYAKLKACDLLSNTGDILRPHQEPVNMCSAARREGVKVEPTYPASLQPKINDAPLVPQDAAHERADEQEKARQK